MKKAILWFAVFLVLLPIFVLAEDEEVLLRKSRLLVQKAQRIEQRGEIEEAVALYEEAYNTYPKNILPLMFWGKAMVKVGMYERAEELLKRIPINNLRDAGQSEVHSLLGKIAVARGSVEDAASAYSKAVQAYGQNASARLHLAAINQLVGLGSRADELLQDIDSFSGFQMPDLRLALLVDLDLGNLGRAMFTSAEISRFLSYQNKGFFSEILHSPPGIFLLNLPLGLGTASCGLYFLCIFCSLLFLSTRLSAPTAFWHHILFVVFGTACVIAAKIMAKRELYLAFMQEDYALADPVWIMPRLLIAGHLIALSLFAIFPAFRLLPEPQRPQRYELFGIWFFCWFFMAFVLIFQSNADLGKQAVLLAVTFALSAIAAFFMPLGRFVIFRVASLFGYAGFSGVGRSELRSSGEISFTDAKILETRAWKQLETDSYEEVKLAARKVLSCYDRKTFPNMWKAYIFALIASEDYAEAQLQLQEFLTVFNKHAVYESGQLYESFLRTLKGDFGGALRLIRGMSEQRVKKSFSADENALSLLVLGCCALARNENVQAHIDLIKAVNMTRVPLIKAIALTEVVELDLNLKAKDTLAKLKDRVVELTGGPLVLSYKDVIMSMLAISEERHDEALALAQKACKNTKVANSRALAWCGHLLCREGRQGDAEKLLTRMAPDSHAAAKLMTEVTSTGSI